ncbi:MAG: chloride channel protein [Luteolibacter sp.]
MNSRLRLPLFAMILGLVVAIAGIGLLRLIALVTNLSYYGRFSFQEIEPGFATFGMLALAAPVVGGLIIGLVARFGSPEIRGHGIPEVMQGVMMNQSRIPLKVALLKPVCAAISIGTGGPFGAEGPVIATGGSIGSLLGQWIPTSASERKTLLSAGAAAGVTAVFGTPLAGVLIAIELLLFEFRSRSLLPVAMAAGTAMAIRSLFGEPFPMLPLPAPQAPGLIITFGAIIIGCSCGFASVGLTKILHTLEHAFEKLPIHWMWKPALGGVAVALIGWINPRTLGPGYESLRELLHGHLAVTAILALLVYKFISWSISLSSGTTGGTLAPLLMLGAALGAVIAHGIARLPHFQDFPIGIAAMIGMAALFAGASRAFLTSVAFSFEATHSSSAFGPLLIGCAFAVLISRWLMKETIMTEKLSRQGIVVPNDYQPDPLTCLSVASSMNPAPLTISPDMTIQDLVEKITNGPNEWQLARLFPIISENRQLVGIISRADVLAALQTHHETTVSAACTRNPFCIRENQSLAEAADLMVLHGVGRLPVLDHLASGRLVGLISRRHILQARQHQLLADRRSTARA